MKFKVPNTRRMLPSQVYQHSPRSLTVAIYPVHRSRSSLSTNMAQSCRAGNPGADPLLLVSLSLFIQKSYFFNDAINTAVSAHPHAFYRKLLALQLPNVKGVDWRKVLIRLHEGAVDRNELDGIKNEVRKVEDAGVRLVGSGSLTYEELRSISPPIVTTRQNVMHSSIHMYN